MKKPVISLIAAMAKNRVIGKDNQMPWHLPADLKHFKSVTMSKPVVMGRKTFDSIGKPLPGRRNLVISRQSGLSYSGAEVFDSIDSAIAALSESEEIMIIGGGNLYRQTLPIADKLYLTFIDLAIEGDTQFPDYSVLELTEVDRQIHLADEKNALRCEFVEYHVMNKTSVDTISID